METLGAHIRKCRLRLGLRGIDVAVKARIAGSMLSNVESGRLVPSDGWLGRLAPAIGETPEELVRRAMLARTPADVLALIPADVVERFIRNSQLATS